MGMGTRVDWVESGFGVQGISEVRFRVVRVVEGFLL